MRPDKEELRRRAKLADTKLRAIGRRADRVRDVAFQMLAVQLPIARLDLYGTPPAKFHAEAYFATTREALRLNTPETCARIEDAIVRALQEVDPSAQNPEIRVEIDSIERLERTEDGYSGKFR